MITYKNLRIIPTYHGSLEFIHEVRKVFYQDPPDFIAVEFPKNLKPKIMQGVQRLPKISMVVYYDELLNQQLYIPISPADSLIEALRLGTEYGIPTRFIDLFVKDYEPPIYNLPDAYALNFLNLNEFYAILNHQMKLSEKAQSNYQKHFQQPPKNQQDNLEKDLLESEGSTSLPAGKEAEKWLEKASEIDNLRNQYMATHLHNLILNNPDDTVLVVLGLNHWASIKYILEHYDFTQEDVTAFETQVSAEIYNVLEKDIPKIIYETPNIIYQFEQFRKLQKKALDKLRFHENRKVHLKKYQEFPGIKQIIALGIKLYNKEYHEKISPHKLKSLMQYMRNLPMIEGKLRPQLFEIVLAAKSIINDDFAWIIWENCKSYPPAKVDPHLDAIQLTKEGIILHGKYFKLRRSIPIKIHKIKLPLKPKPQEKYEGEWRDVWQKNKWNLVSYLPEDIFEENYFRHIRKRTMGMLRNEYTQIHPFTSTLMDGIDFRETIRNWPIEHQIYVKEERVIKGNVDAVVIIFNKDMQGEPKYPYRMMWYAEHEEESDLAFYSTYPGVELIGPGISRIELGGVVSFFPPRGIPNIWTSKFVERYPMAQNKSDRLLMAAMIYAQKPFITYVADEKPREIFYRIARLLGIKILFIKTDRFNPVSLRALRNLHVLAGKKTRKYAHRYINKRKY